MGGDPKLQGVEAATLPRDSLDFFKACGIASEKANEGHSQREVSFESQGEDVRGDSLGAEVRYSPKTHLSYSGPSFSRVLF